MAVEAGSSRSDNPKVQELIALLRERLGPLYMNSSDLENEIMVNATRWRHIVERDAPVDRDYKVRQLRDLLEAAGQQSLADNLFGRVGTVEQVPRTGFRDTYNAIVANLSADEQAQTSATATPAARAPGPSGTTAGTSGATGADSTQALADRMRPQENTNAPATGTPTPAPNGSPTPGGTTGPGGGGNTGTAGDGSTTQGSDLLPEGAQLWLVDGGTYYLAYTVPGHDDVPLLWRIENEDRLNDLFQGGVPAPNRQLSSRELDALAPWQMGGISTELALLGEDPWDIFVEEFRKKAELRPWLNDPSFLAVSAVAYLEGRNELSADELASTDFYNSYTDEQRQWMERSVTASDAELESELADAITLVTDGLRQAGMANPPASVVRYIATQRLTGQWSETQAQQQVRKLADPFAPGTLDKALWALVRDPDATKAVDAQATANGFEAVMARVKDIFTEARVPIATDDESEQERLTRITSEILAGGRTWGSVYASIDRLAALTPGGTPGGVDVTAQGETEVRDLIADWVGPQIAAGYDDRFVREWAGRIRNDPDAQQELVTILQQARLDAFPSHTNVNARYVDMAGPAKSMFTNIWGTAPDEMDPLFLEVLREPSYTQAATLLRKEGMARNVEKVWQDATSALSASPIGERVVRSAI